MNWKPIEQANTRHVETSLRLQRLTHEHDAVSEDFKTERELYALPLRARITREARRIAKKHGGAFVGCDVVPLVNYADKTAVALAYLRWSNPLAEMRLKSTLRSDDDLKLFLARFEASVKANV